MLINDPVHGLVQLDSLQKDLLALPELARLAWIKQLGLAFLSFPGATHTRLGHVIGASTVAAKMARALEVSPGERLLLEAAGLLHDVGHTPFSHALESLLQGDHMACTRDLIVGATRLPLPGTGRIPEVLSSHNVDPAEVGALVEGRHPDPLLQGLIFGNVDSDQLDYLLRDSYFCGVSHGQIDLYRILYTLKADLGSREVLVEEKGVDAVEEMLVARDHMYSAVYGHKTTRIAEMMLLRAMQLAEPPIEDFATMRDHDLTARLARAGETTERMIERVLCRRLYKTAYRVESRGRDERAARVAELMARVPARQLEAELAAEAGLSRGDVIVDLPVSVFELSEPRLKKFKLKVLRRSGERVPLLELSTLAQALTRKESAQTVFATYCDVQHRDAIAAGCRARLE